MYYKIFFITLCLFLTGCSSISLNRREGRIPKIEVKLPDSKLKVKVRSKEIKLIWTKTF